MIKAAVLGFGVVGSGVVEVIENNNSSISKKAGMPVEVKYILDVRDFPQSPFANKIVHDFAVIENDPEVNVVVEVIGGAGIAYEFTKKALLAGKHVVTSNKELVATHGQELLAMAKERNLNYLFEASVGGGIPIIRPLNQCLTANDIEEVVGILNGTTNYILTQMIENHKSFETALKDAQANGYAEQNPAADIEGKDACRKIAILASLIYGREVNPDKIYTEGITKVTLDDVSFADKNKMVIKLLGRATQCKNGKLAMIVAPFLISQKHQLAHVDDVFNGVFVTGNAVGDVMFYGRGAGKLPTASAVVADVVDIARHLEERRDIYWETVEEEFIENHEECNAKYYVRVKCSDGASAVIGALFGKVAMIENKDCEDAAAFITNEGTEKELGYQVEQLSLKGIEVLSAIRVLY